MRGLRPGGSTYGRVTGLRPGGSTHGRVPPTHVPAGQVPPQDPPASSAFRGSGPHLQAAGCSPSQGPQPREPQGDDARHPGGLGIWGDSAAPSPAPRRPKQRTRTRRLPSGLARFQRLQSDGRAGKKQHFSTHPAWAPEDPQRMLPSPRRLLLLFPDAPNFQKWRKLSPRRVTLWRDVTSGHAPFLGCGCGSHFGIGQSMVKVFLLGLSAVG